MSKKWETPELVVLFRGRPEESVLTHCKHRTSVPVAPAAAQDDCNTEHVNCGACDSNANRS